MRRARWSLLRQLRRASLVGGLFAGGALALGAIAPSGAVASSACVVPNSHYQHVIYIQFDNVHLRRDDPNVPSDLEQMPALKGFLTSQGSLLSNDHTVLISHTSNGIVSTLTGLYPDRNGITVGNSYQFFTGDPNSTGFSSAFKYWTDPVGSGDTLPNIITTGQQNTPAPWVPFTRAGCDVGAVSLANIELENTSTASDGDITSVYGNGVSGVSSTQAAIAANDRSEATADFEGISVHCSQADSVSGGMCSSANGGVPDNLPGEPGAYTGFNGMFGALYANQIIAHPGTFTPATTDADSPTFNGQTVPSKAPTVKDVYNYSASPGLGNPTSKPLTDGNGHPGFMGFDPSAAQSLGYLAQMQEAGIPVTMAYIADAHDNHLNSTEKAFGPGQAGYETQLHQYNQAFRAFFDRLNEDGINQSNTLFVVTVEDGDHYAGGPPLNPGCDGVTAACKYASGTTGPHSVGEQNVDLVNALKEEKNDTIPFDLHADDAPTIYVHGSSSRSGPVANNPSVRRLERDMAGLTLQNQRTGGTDDVLQHIADKTDESILHMVNSDPSRTPSFTLFGNPTYFYEQEGPFGYTCPDPNPGPAGCPVVDTGFAWNHGDDNPEIANTWVGFAGPTIRNVGQTSSIWTDHTDVKPTMLSVLGLSPDYAPDGRVIDQVLDTSSLPGGIASQQALYNKLTGAYKQLDAAFGEFGHDSEIVSTRAVQTNSSGDSTYQAWDAQLAACQKARTPVAGQIRTLLNSIEFAHGSLNATQADNLISESNTLVSEMSALSKRSTPPSAPACDV